MKLSQLKFFCAVVEHKTIAAAARELHCVPSNVTLRIKELEDSLGGELFFRDKNRLYVTPKGRLFYQQAGEILALASRSQHLFAGRQPQGLLNLGALDFSLISHLPDRIAHLRRSQPQMQVNVLSRDSLVLERMLIDSELDLALTDGPIEHPLLASRVAFDERLVLLIPASVTQLDAATLAQLEFYTFSRECSFRLKIDHWLASRQLKPRMTLEMESYTSMAACVKAGCGVACIPGSLLPMILPSQALNVVEMGAEGVSNLYFVWRRHQLSEELQTAIDLLVRPA
ncbi:MULTISPECIES: LysR family transcriptional regulator [unclassified Serratia (in: enterobacteria)]|uniref:LysR family transcriptional regulator n=1 Tax=unclassified Serratia (in: enterobacteria) TaxID=2647522 RepID=UPI001AEAD47B|nr:LysR family transcriptional regulator [Serratia sp. PL17]MBP1129990.1 DNA-binding transcriptional LysR family regulator [Serratia sp. PL17]